MNDKSNEFYNLIVFCEGTMTGFIVDSDTLDKFEQSFNSDKTALASLVVVGTCIWLSTHPVR